MWNVLCGLVVNSFSFFLFGFFNLLICFTLFLLYFYRLAGDYMWSVVCGLVVNSSFKSDVSFDPHGRVVSRQVFDLFYYYIKNSIVHREKTWIEY